jgi:hypothetical protein
VRGLQKFLGPAAQHYHSFYLWGDGVSPLKPYAPGRAGRPILKWGHRSATLRARIPFELAYCVADFLRNLLEIRTIDRVAPKNLDRSSQGGSRHGVHAIGRGLPSTREVTSE